MKFFVPDWEDKVDPSFDFQADLYAADRNVSADIYAHEVFEASPYDGILISRAVAQKSQTKYETLLREGARRYLRLPPGLEVFGDCGAFSYVNEDEPWYKTADVLDYYAAVQVDYGASVDHLVVETIYEVTSVEEKLEDSTVVVKKKKQKKQMPEAERKRRIQLTLDNAQDFLHLHRKKGYRFIPVGVAQGWSPDTYASSVRHLLKMGYRYIALGGLARSSASTVLNVLIAANQAVEECSHSNDVRFHLFGVAKLTLIAKLPEYRVASIDSASYLRKAWLRSGQNYLGIDKQWYTAIRVPQSSHHRVRKYIEKNGKSMENVRAQEQSILQSLQQYSDSGLSPAQLEELLDAIVEYDTYMLRLGDDGQSLRNETVSREKYRRTLQARPWEQCPCKVCQDLQIHALIFRGTNRNKRRGFHNTWTFYQRLKAAD